MYFINYKIVDTQGWFWINKARASYMNWASVHTLREVTTFNISIAETGHNISITETGHRVSEEKGFTLALSPKTIVAVPQPPKSSPPTQ